MPGDITPEEKLLRLIKDGSSQAKKEDPLLNDAPIVNCVLLQKKIDPPKTYHAFWINGLSILSSCLIGLFTLILGYQVIEGQPVIPLPIHKNNALESLRFPSLSLKKTEIFDFYAKPFQKANLFKSAGEPPPVTYQENTTGFRDLIKNYSLSGIIDGDDPQAIIEDKTNGQVYYVEAGGYVGSLQVIEVRNNSVLLRYGNEEGQLTL